VRIATFYTAHSPNAAYRCFGPSRALEERGHQVLRLYGERPLDVRELAQFDVFQVFRESQPPLTKAVQALCKAGVAVVWDVDDDWRALPRSTPAWDKIGGGNGERFFAESVRIARASTLMTTTCDAIAQAYGGYGVEPIEVIDNYLLREFVVAPAHDGRNVTIGWVAGHAHTEDMIQLGMSDVLGRILAAHKNVRVESIGVDLQIDSDRYTHHAMVPFNLLFEHIARYDIGIAPLADIPFNHARSSGKPKEYAAAGVPWLASPIGPYGALGEEQGGRLVADDDWYDELDRLVRKRRAREHLARQARAWGEQQTIDRHAGLWEAALQRAIGLTQTVPKVPIRPARSARR
jgi:hypothetical protein